MYLSQGPLTAVGVVTATAGAVTHKLTLRGLLFACHIFVTMVSVEVKIMSRIRDNCLRGG